MTYLKNTLKSCLCVKGVMKKFGGETPNRKIRGRGDIPASRRINGIPIPGHEVELGIATVSSYICLSLRILPVFRWLIRKA